MPDSQDDFLKRVEQLSDPKSSKRRSAAKWLRKHPDPKAGPSLVEALVNELKDSRTWETQYEMIMALGYCCYTPALSLLRETASKPHEATMVDFGLGHAITRIELEENGGHGIDEILGRLFSRRNRPLILGALQAIALLQLRPSDHLVTQIITLASTISLTEDECYWHKVICSAARNWPGSEVKEYLLRCRKEGRAPIDELAEMALSGKSWKVERYIT